MRNPRRRHHCRPQSCHQQKTTFTPPSCCCPASRLSNVQSCRRQFVIKNRCRLSARTVSRCKKPASSDRRRSVCLFHLRRCKPFIALEFRRCPLSSSTPPQRPNVSVRSIDEAFRPRTCEREPGANLRLWSLTPSAPLGHTEPCSGPCHGALSRVGSIPWLEPNRSQPIIQAVFCPSAPAFNPRFTA